MSMFVTAMSCLRPMAGGEALSSKIGPGAPHPFAPEISVPVPARQITD
jgi:hypothetical protein